MGRLGRPYAALRAGVCAFFLLPSNFLLFMKQLIRINLTTRTAVNWQPPELAFGERLTLALRLLKTSEGEEVEAGLTVSTIKAAIGRVDARPEGGVFSIKVGAGAATNQNTTGALDFDIAASALKAALEAVPDLASYGTPRVVGTDGSWLIFFGEQDAQVPLSVVRNTLWPVSFGRIHAWQVDGRWVHELRLTQAPVAFTSSFDVVLPPPPVVTRIQTGGSDSVMTWNEIQELYLPPEFLGAYQLRLGTGKTTLLSREDGLEVIEEALQALGAGGFKVTLPLSNRANIEFVGDYAGLPMDLLTAHVEQSPPGDLTFSLDLDRAELAALLRRAGGAAVTLPLEIRLTGTDENGLSGELVALSLDVVIRPPVIWPDIEEMPTLDLLRPYSPRTYVPYGANNELVGEKYYRATVGDGTATEFVLATGLNSEVVYVWARENVSGGALLTQGVDYSVTVDNDNQVTVTALDGAPAVDAWVVVAFSAQPLPQWAADLTVTVPQVVAGDGYPSLPDFMDNMSQRVGALEAVLPSIGPGTPTSSGTGMVTIIPEVKEILFARDLDEGVFSDKGVDAARLNARRAPVMLPAVHDATPTDPLPAPLPSPVAATVWVANGRTLIPGGGGIRSAYVEDDGYVASDGRQLYVATRWASTNSYYPTACERQLFAMALNDKMMAVGRTYEALWGVQTQLIHASCQAQWVLSVQLGTFTAETEPAVLGLNLENVVWAAPVFEQAIVLSPLSQSHFFGIRIRRLAGGFELDQQRYGVWAGNNAAAPSSANFAIRARLDRWDTENRTAPRGYVAWRLVGSLDVDDEGKETTKPAQARIY